MIKKYRGFTLIELLVVIAIIGILASIVLVSLATARNRAYDAEVKSELAQVRSNLEMEYIDENSYEEYGDPTSTDSLAPPDCSDDAAYLIAYGDCKTTGTPNTDCQNYVIWSDTCAADYDWCVDSSGTSKQTAAAVVLTAGAANAVTSTIVCP